MFKACSRCANSKTKEVARFKKLASGHQYHKEHNSKPGAPSKVQIFAPILKSCLKKPKAEAANIEAEAQSYKIRLYESSTTSAT